MEKDVKEVMSAEKERGRKRLGLSRKKEKELALKMEKLLEVATEQEFAQRLREDFGLSDRSSEFAKALEVWRTQRARR